MTTEEIMYEGLMEMLGKVLLEIQKANAILQTIADNTQPKK